MDCNDILCESQVSWGHLDILISTGTEKSGSNSLQGQRISLLCTVSSPTLRHTFTPIQWVAIYFGEKQLGQETNHSPPSRVNIRAIGAILPLPMHLHCVVLIDSAQ
jgi:hypothetical protein